MKLAYSLYHELLENKLPPDHNVYNLLIGACTAAGDFAAAKNVFTEMRDKARTDHVPRVACTHEGDVGIFARPRRA